jgi:hypothetical protein
MPPCDLGDRVGGRSRGQRNCGRNEH